MKPPSLSPVLLLPRCDRQGRDVPNSILPESLASWPGRCQTGCPKQKGIISGIIIMVIVWQRVSLAAAIIYSMIATNVWPSREGCA
jgi:hypothetical protein